MAKTDRIKVGKEVFTAVVLQLVEDDEQGRPRLLRIVRQDETVDLKGGERFFIVYGDAKALHEKRIKA